MNEENANTTRRREEKAQRKLIAQKEFKDAKLEEIKGVKQDIARNINRDMLTARGLVRKRKREDANPRVKKRRAYEKMVK